MRWVGKRFFRKMFPLNHAHLTSKALFSFRSDTKKERKIRSNFAKKRFFYIKAIFWVICSDNLPAPCKIRANMACWVACTIKINCLLPSRMAEI